MKKLVLLCMVMITFACEKEESQKSFDASVNKMYVLEFITENLDNSVTVYAGTEVTYQDSYEFIASQYNVASNSIIIETKEGPTKIESNLYIEDGSPVSIILYDNLGNIVDQEEVSQIGYTYTYEFN